MSNELQIFNYQSNEVRVVEQDGEPWFVGKDVCDILELENITNALKSLDPDDLTLTILKSGAQNREMKLISESGLYTLILRSNKPEAKNFRRWVTHDVLPSIRKTGMYLSDKAVNAEKMTLTNSEGHSGQLQGRQSVDYPSIFPGHFLLQELTL